MSSACDESLSGSSGRVPVKGVSPVVPVAEASLSSCPVLPVYDSLERDQSPCGRGSIVVCTKRDCRLVVGPSGCNNVVVVVGDGKAQLVLLPFGLASERRVSCISCSSSSSPVEARSPCSCIGSRRRARKLTWCTAVGCEPWPKSPKLCG